MRQYFTTISPYITLDAWAAPAETFSALALTLTGGGFLGIPTPSAGLDGLANAGLTFTYGVPDQTSADALAVDVARADYNTLTGGTLTGAGEIIGILSDSFNLDGGEAADIANGSLPPAAEIDILKDGASGNDEGRAMAQLIYQIAPGVKIDFYTAADSEADFAAGIGSLVAAGCNVIVDDVEYTDEPFYQNTGVVTEAVEAAVAAGVDYFTAAGNSSNNFYEADFTAIPGRFDLPGIGNKTTENVDGAGSPYESINVSANNAQLDLTLEWDQPFGANQYDLGAALYAETNGTYSLAYNFKNTGVTSDPELLIDQSTTLTAGTYYLAFYESAGRAAPGEFKIISFEDSDTSFTEANAGIGSGTSIGHQLATGANAVGAVNIANTPEYGQAVPTTEDFSAYGPGATYINAAGQTYSTPERDNAPAFAATDGTPTSVFPIFDGTSAAAPNAAAVSLLMLQADSRLATQQVTYLLERSAIPTTSTITGGAGLIQADTAVVASVSLATSPLWTAQAGTTLWDTAGNWSDNAVPAAGSEAQITDGAGLFTGPYDVLDDEAVDSVNSLLVDGGTITGAVPTLSILAGNTLETSGLTLGQGTISIAGTLDISGDVTTGSTAGVIDLGPAARLAADGALAAVDIAFTGTAAVLDLATANATVLESGLNAVISGFAAGDLIDLPGLAESLVSTLNLSDQILTLSGASGVLAELDLNTSLNHLFFAKDATGGTEIACFCAGTRIRTPKGEIPVEDIRPGDHVTMARDTSPGTRRVIWTGYRHMRLTHHPEPELACPILIKAGAIAPGLPARDLRVSPLHGVYVNGGLVEARALVNHATILQERNTSEVTYHHLELETHDILLAEGMPSESYLDTGNRAMFTHAAWEQEAVA